MQLGGYGSTSSEILTPFAAGREEEHLACINQVGIADGRVGASDTGCVRGAAELGLCDLGERVAGPHGEPDVGTEGRDRSGQNNLRAGHDVVGVENARIGREQFMPAESVTKV